MFYVFSSQVIISYSQNMKNDSPSSHIHGEVYHECANREYQRIFLI